MKQYILIMGLLLMVLSSSCASFLDEDPSHVGTAETYYLTKEGLDNGVNACYASLRETHRKRDLWITGTDTYGDGGIAYEGGLYQTFNTYDPQVYTADNRAFSDFWSNMYSAISTCNSVIHFSRDAKVESEYKNTRLAEVRVLRALYYSYLVEQFGDIPFLMEQPKGILDEADMEKESVIYDVLIRDVEDAINYLPERTEDFGRVTLGVAQLLLSKLYLTRGYKDYGKDTDFVKSAELAQRIIDSKVYSLLPDFAKLFEPGNEKNSEVIFSVQYSDNLSSNGDGNSMHLYWGIKYDLWPGMGRSKVYNRTMDYYAESFFLLKSFEFNGSYKIDKRFDGTFIRLWLAESDKTYKNKAGASDPEKEYTIHKGDTAIYITYPNEHFSQEKVDQVSYGLVYADYYKHGRWGEYIGETQYNGDYLGARPANHKFWEPGMYEDNKGVRDLYIYRLGEVYLIAAEAYYKSNNLPKATEMLNVIRRRACGNDINTPSIMDISQEKVDIDFILDERARELCGEDNRWVDLKRTGKLVERCYKYNDHIKVSKKLKEAHVLRPYPSSWLERLQNKDEIKQREF